MGRQRLQETISKQLVNGIKIEKLSFCEGCIEGKCTRNLLSQWEKSVQLTNYSLIHSDVCGPMSTESIGGKKYFVTFTDDHSRCCSVYFMKHKSEVLDKFEEFEAATTSSGQRIRKLRTDNGGEYVSNEFEAYLKSKGIFHELFVPHSPE